MSNKFESFYISIYILPAESETPEQLRVVILLKNNQHHKQKTYQQRKCTIWFVVKWYFRFSYQIYTGVLKSCLYNHFMALYIHMWLYRMWAFTHFLCIMFVGSIHNSRLDVKISIFVLVKHILQRSQCWK